MPPGAIKSIANISGYTKRALTASLSSVNVGIANIVGPQTFQARNAPGYRPAKIVAFATKLLCALDIILLYLYYRRENARRNREHKEDILEDD
ncbi:hypothetical protein V2W45_1456130 [Cenococcum geophilum]